MSSTVCRRLRQRAAYLKQLMRDKRVDHKEYIARARRGHAGDPRLAVAGLMSCGWPAKLWMRWGKIARSRLPINRNSAIAMTQLKSFAALRHPGFRMFFIGNATAMLADNMEHVITYWVMFQKFNSPALSGFAMISHWLPFLVFAVPAGVLADRVDPRRMIQVGMLLFMSVSLAWGVLIATDTLQIWHAMILLVLHGLAGVCWMAP